MDWFSWLSKTSLELTLVYDYGVLFACNELTCEDIAHFDHEFLKSMGISVAKHRLEIIKLATATTRQKGGVSGRVREAIERTRRRVMECARKLMFLERNSKMVVDKEEREDRRGQMFMLTQHFSHTGHWIKEKGMSEGYRSPRIMRSGPMERNRGEARVKAGHSGPLDKFKVRGGRNVCVPERRGCEGNKSPVMPLTPTPMCRIRSPRDGDGGVDSLWANLFQDMKPT